MFSLFKSTPSEAVLLVGLGNPGDKYKKNRHNIGFMAIEAIADTHNFPSAKSKYEGLLQEGMIDGHKTLLLRPQTYMNESGRSIQKTAKFYKIPPERIIVFHDELDLAAGKIKVKQGGGNAGHNGLKSTQRHLGTADFWRVRLGIGHPGQKEKVHSHVLSDFAKADQIWLGPLLDALAKECNLLVKKEGSRYIEAVSNQVKAT